MVGGGLRVSLEEPKKETYEGVEIFMQRQEISKAAKIFHTYHTAILVFGLSERRHDRLHGSRSRSTPR